MTDIEVASPKEIVDRLNELAIGYPDAVSEAIWMELSEVLNESKKICPVDKGALRGSGRVPEPEITNGHIRASIGYSQGYAWWVHELIGNYHQPPTQAKYLEQPLVQALPGLVDRVVARTLSLLER